MPDDSAFRSARDSLATGEEEVFMYVCRCVCMYVCLYVCMYVTQRWHSGHAFRRLLCQFFCGLCSVVYTFILHKDIDPQPKIPSKTITRSPQFLTFQGYVRYVVDYKSQDTLFRAIELFSMLLTMHNCIKVT